MLPRNKRGIELSMNVVIIAILAILVLIFVSLFFTGGFTGIANKIKEIFGAQPIDEGTLRIRCDGLCSNYDLINSVSAKRDVWNQFCNEVREAYINNNGKIDTGESRTCEEITNCASINCAAEPS